MNGHSLPERPLSIVRGEIRCSSQALRQFALHENLAVVDVGETMPAAGHARFLKVPEISGGQGELIDDMAGSERQALSHKVAVVVVRRDLARLTADDSQSAILKLDAVVRLRRDEELLEKEAIRRPPIDAAQIPPGNERAAIGRHGGQ